MIKPLGKVLVECGIITNMDLSRALVRQRSSGSAKRMGDILLEMGLVTGEQLKAALEKQHDTTPSPMAAEPRAQSFAPRTPPPPPAFCPPQTRQPASQGLETKGLMALLQLLIKKEVISLEEYFQEVQGN
ncbi:MAG: hypothetical protein HZA01_08375 [Nitrospinae bacterium]|nr:hypothetical protein [Nitrospinota bacterium]